jgi:hypothetical protein
VTKEDAHKELFDLVRGQAKDFSELYAVIKSHVESSTIRVEGWEKKFIEIDKKMECYEKKIKEILDFKESVLQKRAVVVSIFSMIGYIMSILVGLGTIYLVFK